MNNTEAHEKLKADILVRLSLEKNIRVWASNTGSGFTRGGFFMKFGKKGSADITGILYIELKPGVKLGLRLEIEVKTGKGVQSKDQILFMNMIHSMGGIYYVARDVDSCVKYLLDKARELGPNSV